MILAEFDWNPNHRKLRQFGCIPLLIAPAIIWIWGVSGTAAAILAGAAILLCALGLLRPRALRPLYLGVSVITIPIGFVVGEIALLATYVVVFVPLGLVFKVLRRDGLGLAGGANATTHWQAKRSSHDPASYYRQS